MTHKLNDVSTLFYSINCGHWFFSGVKLPHFNIALAVLSGAVIRTCFSAIFF